MTKFATQRIWRDPDGKLIAEDEVKDGKAGGLGTVLAYAVGDEIEGEDEDNVTSKLASSKAPDAVEATGLATAAGTVKAGPKSKPASKPTARGRGKAKAKPAETTTPVEPAATPADPDAGTDDDEDDKED